MNLHYTNLLPYIRVCCLLMVAALGVVVIVGSGDGEDTSTEYETFSPTINLDTVNVVFNENDPDPVTYSCTSYTSMNKEFQDAYPDETRDLTIVTGTIDAVEVGYNNAFYISKGSDEPIGCESYVDGDYADFALLDVTSIDPPSSDWMPADNPSVFTNYIRTDSDAAFRICVQCFNNNLYASYTLDYLTRISMTLTARESNPEETEE